MHYSNDPKKPQQHHNDQSNEPLAQQNPPQSQHEVMRQRHHSQHNHQKQLAIKETVGALVVWNQLSYGGFLANALWHFLLVPWAIFWKKFLAKNCLAGKAGGGPKPSTLLYRREL